MAWSWAFGRRAPLGQNRGGTPIDVRIPKDARPCPAARHEDNLRLSAFRFLLFMLGEASVADRKPQAPPLLFPSATLSSDFNRSGACSSAPAIAGEGDRALARWRGRVTHRFVIVERVS